MRSIVSSIAPVIYFFATMLIGCGGDTAGSGGSAGATASGSGGSAGTAGAGGFGGTGGFGGAGGFGGTGGSGGTGWTYLADFESGVLGEPADSNIGDGFNTAGGKTFYDDTFVYNGNKVAKCTVRQGRSDFGTLGGVIDFVTVGHANVHEGETLYIRVNTFFPAGFNFETNTGHLKFLRATHRGGDGVARGRLDLLIRADDYRFGRENNDGPWQGFFPIGTGQGVTTGEWESVILAVRAISPDALDGSPTVEFYKLTGGAVVDQKRVGGSFELLWSTSTFFTLNDTNGFFNDFLFFTYWNGGGNGGTGLWMDSPVSAFTIGNVVKGSTSLTENTLVDTWNNSLQLASVASNTPPEWTAGETVVEYDPTGTTPTGVTSVIENMWPRKNQEFWVDDITVGTARPAELP